MKRLALVGIILLSPMFWPLVFYTWFLKQIDKAPLDIYLTTTTALVTAACIFIQVGWIMFWIGG